MSMTKKLKARKLSDHSRSSKFIKYSLREDIYQMDDVPDEFISRTNYPMAGPRSDQNSPTKKTNYIRHNMKVIKPVRVLKTNLTEDVNFVEPSRGSTVHLTKGKSGPRVKLDA